jgi:hypothetical protein
MKTEQTQAQLALGEIRYILDSTTPSRSTADQAIRHALEITAQSLTENPDMLNAQRIGLEALNEFSGLAQRLPPPSLVSPRDPRLGAVKA